MPKKTLIRSEKTEKPLFSKGKWRLSVNLSRLKTSQLEQSLLRAWQWKGAAHCLPLLTCPQRLFQFVGYTTALWIDDYRCSDDLLSIK